MRKQDPLTVTVVDDTGFLKQGKHSVGVQRQYTGSAGKITNCQVGVSVCVSNRIEQVPVDFELYLPEKWLEDAALREEARIPNDRTFKTKPELALEMIRRAKDSDMVRFHGVLAPNSALHELTQDAIREGLLRVGLPARGPPMRRTAPFGQLSLPFPKTRHA